MSIDPASHLVTCPVCGTAVPAGVFCGFCGAHLSGYRTRGPAWLRIRAFAPAASEHVLRMSLISSVFPHLASRSRAAFRMGFAAVVVLVVGFALLRWQAALVAVSSVGFAMLYLIYLEESDVYGDEDLPLGTLTLTAALGAVLGFGWAYWTGPVVAQSYYTLGGLPPQKMLLFGLVVPAGGALLMLAPAVVIWLTRPRQLESLDGFLIGSLGATAFTAAGTFTRLAPQLTHGVVAHNQYVKSLLVEAAIQGVAVPVTAAATGGLVGAALWLTRAAGSHRIRKTLGALALTTAATLAVYTALGSIDIRRPAPGLQVTLHLLIAGIAVLVSRIVVHLALLNEARTEMTQAATRCAECHHLVPEMAFCLNCGTAQRASSRSSRNERRLQTMPEDS